MSERGFNGNGSHHQFFEQSFSEISSIELVTEFIKIELQELPLDSMVHVREYGFRIGYGRVHPRKHLVPFLGLDDTTRMVLSSVAIKNVFLAQKKHVSVYSKRTRNDGWDIPYFLLFTKHTLLLASFFIFSIIVVLIDANSSGSRLLVYPKSVIRHAGAVFG